MTTSAVLTAAPMRIPAILVPIRIISFHYVWQNCLLLAERVRDQHQRNVSSGTDENACNLGSHKNHLPFRYLTSSIPKHGINFRHILEKPFQHLLKIHNTHPLSVSRLVRMTINHQKSPQEEAQAEHPSEYHPYRSPPFAILIVT